MKEGRCRDSSDRRSLTYRTFEFVARESKRQSETEQVTGHESARGKSCKGKVISGS